jgi:hypothetical protein
MDVGDERDRVTLTLTSHCLHSKFLSGGIAIVSESCSALYGKL